MKRLDPWLIFFGWPIAKHRNPGLKLWRVMKFFSDLESALKCEIANKDAEIYHLKLKLQTAEIELEKKDEKFGRGVKQIEEGEGIPATGRIFSPKIPGHSVQIIISSQEELTKIANRVGALERLRKMAEQDKKNSGIVDYLTGVFKTKKFGEFVG